VKRWLLSSFLISFLSVGLAGTQVLALGVAPTWFAEEDAASEEKEEQAARSSRQNRRTSRGKQQRPIANVPRFGRAIAARIVGSPSGRAHFVFSRLTSLQSFRILRV
jgi:uncharacterized membrane protein